MFGLEHFGFAAKWSPYFMLFVAVVAVGYHLVTGPYRHRFPGSRPVSAKQKFYFMSGLAVLYIAQGSPLDLLGHLIFSAHMLSMALAFLAVPPLIWRGTPDWLVRPVIQKYFSGKLRVLFHPVVTLLAFNSLFSLYHMPDVHDYIMVNYGLHFVFFVVLYLAAFLMWWHLAGPLPDWRPLSDLKKIGYILLNGILLTPACALIIFAGKPIFATYNDPDVWVKALGFCVPGDPSVILLQFGGPEYFALFPPVHDQQLGGVLMKLIQELIYAGFLSAVIARWYCRENRETEIPEPEKLEMAEMVSP